MTLRTRILAAAVTLMVVLVAALTAIVLRQRSVLMDQIDEQLEQAAATIGQAAERGFGRTILPDRADEDGPPTGDLYLALLLNDGSLLPFVEPVSDPGFAPEGDGLLDRVQVYDPDDPDAIEPFTVDAVGDDGRARVVALRAEEGLTLVIARSTARIDDAQRQLAVTSLIAVIAVAAMLALVVWWVDRLGLQPISRLTVAAEQVAAGRSERRVEHPPVTTETGRLGAAFNTMLDARQEAEDRQRRFVADASHELRTPLTTLRGYAALHASGGLTTPASVDDAMNRIRTEADRMAALVEDLLTLASRDEDRPLDLETVDLSQLLIDIGSDAAAVQPDRPVDTDRVGPDLIVSADRNLLTQALTAVTTNVLRHTPAEAGLTLSARSRTAVGEPPRVEVEIADRGPGIAADQLPHLFDRFYRVDTGRAAPTGGRGLGLSIAKTVVEAHGGSVEASSTPGRGTTIHVTLPTGTT